MYPARCQVDAMAALLYTLRRVPGRRRRLLERQVITKLPSDLARSTNLSIGVQRSNKNVRPRATAGGGCSA
jgi:hypothetical protein